jgi:hypothetical protein
MASHHVAARPVPYSHSFRIGLQFEAGKVTLISLHRVAMRAPASAPGLPADKQSGVWVELTAEGGEVLYHRPLRSPHLDSLEVFENEKTGDIRRVQSKPRALKQDVILPDLPQAAAMVLYGAKDPRQTQAPSVPLLKIPLRDLRQQAQRAPTP